AALSDGVSSATSLSDSDPFGLVVGLPGGDLWDDVLAVGRDVLGPVRAAQRAGGDRDAKVVQLAQPVEHLVGALAVAAELDRGHGGLLDAVVVAAHVGA